MDTTDSKKYFKVRDVKRFVEKEILASTLEELRSRIVEAFQKPGEEPKVHLDSDGTEIDDEEYFSTVEENTKLVAVFSGERWIDNTIHLNIITDCKDRAAEMAHIKRSIKRQLRKNKEVLYDPRFDPISSSSSNEATSDHNETTDI